MPVVLLLEGGRLGNSLLVGAVVIVCFGLWDDLRTLGWKAKFLGQTIAAALVVGWGGLRIFSLGSLLPSGIYLPEWVAVSLAMLAIIGVTNAINLSDGLDGLAGGTSFITFVTLGLIGITGADFPERDFLILLCCTAAGAIQGFLRFNTFPASVFMGDTGSQLLGFLLITLALAMTQRETPLSPLSVLLVLGFPVLDTFSVMAERIASGRNPFTPDNNHFHHKLIRLGFYQTEAVAAIYALTAALSAAAFFLRYHSDWLILVVWGGVSVLVVVFFIAADRWGFRFDRKGVFDFEVRGWPGALKEKRIAIRTSFWILRWGLPTCFCAAALLPEEVPRWGGWAALAALGGGSLVRLFRPQWFPATLRGSFFISVPFVLTQAMSSPAVGLDPRVGRCFEGAFVVLAIAIVLTLRLTRRKKGYRTSPTDFLILLVALILPNIPDPIIAGVKLGSLAVQMIVFFYGYEVAVGEMQGRISRFAIGITASFVVLAIRGLL